jgi:[methyl-Co(III) methanol-specific corrinoid protein]:coenzyme M methyltransferase
MTIYTPKEELIKTLSGEDIGYFPRPIPIFTPVFDMMKKTDAYFPDANYQAEPMARLALAAIELGGWNCTMIPWASTVEMEALGCTVINRRDDRTSYPQFKERAFSDAYDVTFSRDILKKGSFPAVFHATRIVKNEINSKYDGCIPIVSMCQGPFTIASYTIGVNEMYKHMIKDLKRARKALDVVAELLVLYCNTMLECGGDVVVVSDPAAEGLTGDQFGGTIVPVYKKITDSIGSSRILHVCGRTGKLASHLPISGFHGFSFDYPGVEIGDLRTATEGKMRLVGSIPTISHLLEGSEKDVFDISMRMIEQGVDLLSPACGLPQYTSLENVRAMARAIEEWNLAEGVSFDSP